jgi:hypothetical protein
MKTAKHEFGKGMDEVISDIFLGVKPASTGRGDLTATVIKCTLH